MKGYKGFDKDFRCRDMQYEVGRTYRHDGELKLCDSGFHFCQNPLAVFEYYSPIDSRYALIEATGNIVEGDDKCCTDELTIVCELTLAELIAAVPDEKKSTNTGDCSVATNTGDWSVATNTGDWSVVTNKGNGSVATNTGNCSAATNTGNGSAATNTGDWSVATNTGYGSAATNTGYWSVATNTGDCSAAKVAGRNSVALVTGRDSRAKGALGCWLVLAEWRNDRLADLQAFKVDGEHIKPDTFYQLIGGKPVVKEEV